MFKGAVLADSAELTIVPQGSYPTNKTQLTNSPIGGRLQAFMLETARQ
jgi:hypothetical protein